MQKIRREATRTTKYRMYKKK